MIFHFVNNYFIPVPHLEENSLNYYITENKNGVTTPIEQETKIQNEETTQVEETTTQVETTTSAPKTTTIKQEEKKVNKNFGAFKSYTDYRCLSRSSKQWSLQEQAYTDENGLRKIGDAYLVALGSYYGTTLGTKYEVTLSNGNKFNIILCDCKDDRHTDQTHKYTLANGCVLEFYVETEKMPSAVRRRGNISAIEFFNGSVVSIERTAE